MRPHLVAASGQEITITGTISWTETIPASVSPGDSGASGSDVQTGTYNINETSTASPPGLGDWTSGTSTYQVSDNLNETHTDSSGGCVYTDSASEGSSGKLLVGPDASGITVDWGDFFYGNNVYFTINNDFSEQVLETAAGQDCLSGGTYSRDVQISPACDESPFTSELIGRFPGNAFIGPLSINCSGTTSDGGSFTATGNLLVADAPVCADTAGASSRGGGPVVRAMAPACGLVADAGGPYNPVRAASFMLDGSKSKDSSGHRITEWKWTWAPGDNCRPGTKLTTDSKTGETVTIKALCDLKVRLTVTNDASPPDHSYADVYVSVKARPGFDKTPASYQPGPKGHAGTPNDQPLATAKWDAGRNVSACDARTEHLNDRLCPAPENDSYQNHGYTTDLLDDPGGPFDLFPYVTTTDLSVNTIGLLNPYILKGGPIPDGACPKPKAATCIDLYAYNKLHGGQVDAWIAAIKEHEGTGAPGKPLTGHASAAAAAAKMNKGNIRKLLEATIGLTTADGQFVPYLNSEVTGVNLFIANYGLAADSHDIGTYKVYFWRPPKGRTAGAWVLMQDTV